MYRLRPEVHFKIVSCLRTNFNLKKKAMYCNVFRYILFFCQALISLEVQYKCLHLHEIQRAFSKRKTPRWTEVMYLLLEKYHGNVFHMNRWISVFEFCIPYYKVHNRQLKSLLVEKPLLYICTSINIINNKFSQFFIKIK